MKQVTIFFNLLLLLFLNINFEIVNAQNDPLKGKDSLLLEFERKEGLPPSEKPLVTLPKPDIEIKSSEFRFTALELPFLPEVSPINIKPEPISKPKWQKLYPNYFKVGFGRFVNPLAHLYISQGRNANLDYGIEVKHNSIHKGWLNHTNFRENEANLNLKYISGNTIFSSKIGFYNNSYSFYGDSTFVEQKDKNDTISMGFTQLNVQLGIANKLVEKGLQYNIPIQFQFYSDKYKTSEWAIHLKPNLTYKLDNNLSIFFRNQSTFSGLKFDTLSTNRTFLDFQLGAGYKKDKFIAEAGVKLNYYAAKMQNIDTSKFTFAPLVKASYQIVDETLQGFIGVFGGMNFNQLYNFRSQNWYLGQFVNIMPTREKIGFLGGFKGFRKNFAYEASVSYTSLENQALFTSSNKDTLYKNTFLNQGYQSVIYDSKFSKTAIQVGLAYNKLDHLSFGIKMDYNIYKTTDVEAAFQLPAFQLLPYVHYNFGNKIYFKTSLLFVGSRKMGPSQTSLISEKMYIDWNLNVEYLFSKRFSVFLEGNNLLNQKIYQYQNYLAKPIDVKAGIILSF